MRLPLLLLLAACTGTDDKPADTDTDSDTAVDTDTDLPADDTGTPVDPHAPTTPEIVLVPAAPPAGVDFAVVIVTESTDPDGDPVTYRYGWTENGAARADLTGAGIPGAETLDGEVWAVTVTPNDGALDGTPATATLTVGNAAPSAFGVTFTPTAPVDGDDITIVLDPPAIDPDGDPLTTSVTWYEDSSLNTVHTDKTTIEGRYVSGGEVFRAIVSITDGYHEPVVAEGTVTVANNPPEIASVRLDPSSPADDDDLTVIATATDPDGSTVTLSYKWYRDGVEVPELTDLDTVPAAATEVGQTWYVDVTASDGTDSVTGPSDSVTVIPFEGYAYTRALTARIAPGGATGTATWAYDILSYGGRRGTNECELQWSVDLADDPRSCPACEYSFDATYTYDTAVSVVTTGTTCTDLATDGRGALTYEDSRASFYLSFYGSSYYTYSYLSFSGSNTVSYSGYGYDYYKTYSVSQETDTAGYTTLTAYQRDYRYY